MKFTKMQAAGNDYVYIDVTRTPVPDPESLARRISDRHFGVGSDGLVLIGASEIADVRMSMFNGDGSEAEMCGNAIRCVGKYVFENGLVLKDALCVETLAGTRELALHVRDGLVERVTVDMGQPELAPEHVPVTYDGENFINEGLRVQGRIWQVTAVSMGDPHAVVHTRNIDQLDLPTLGPQFEHHPLFPRRTNTEFVEVVNRTQLRMRVWERGAGETLACGTGACAALVASVLTCQSERKANVTLRGGELAVEWNEASGHVFMTGDAVVVFTGEYRLA